MNALTVGSYAAIALIGFLVLLKLYKLVKAEGARQQERKDMEAFNAMLKDVAPDFYADNFGTDALGVLDLEAWGNNTGAKPEFRLVSDKGDGRRRDTPGDEDKREDGKHAVSDRER
jgi:hypothetical protein